MNPSARTTMTSGSVDESDDPGPSRGGAEEPPEPVVRIAGEAAREIDRRWLGDHLAQAARLLSAPVRAVNVEVVYDDRMTVLHERHLGVPETTDVLTFTEQGGAGDAIEADIAVCVDEARWRADQYQHAVERELLLYVLHGLLHCAGFDDHDEAGFAAMHAEEDRILEAIGVGRTFYSEVFAGAAGAAGHDALPVERPAGARTRRRDGRDTGNEG